MAKAPGKASAFDGSGAVWFKVKEVTAVTDGGKSINFPSLSKFGDVGVRQRGTLIPRFLQTWAQ